MRRWHSNWGLKQTRINKASKEWEECPRKTYSGENDSNHLPRIELLYASSLPSHLLWPRNSARRVRFFQGITDSESANKSPEASYNANTESYQRPAVVHSFVLEPQGQSKAMDQNQEEQKRQAFQARGKGQQPLWWILKDCLKENCNNRRHVLSDGLVPGTAKPPTSSSHFLLPTPSGKRRYMKKGMEHPLPRTPIPSTTRSHTDPSGTMISIWDTDCQGERWGRFKPCPMSTDRTQLARRKECNREPGRGHRKCLEGYFVGKLG